MSGRSRLLRSRSRGQRRAQRPTTECIVCGDPLGDEELWNCITCHATFHRRCITTTEGRLHLPRGCYVCGTTMSQLISIAQEPIPAPRGAMCYICRSPIDEDAPMHRCAAPRSYCLATWHPECYRRRRNRHAAPRSQCPGCEMGTYAALCLRQHR